jgi:hypothetical protein
MHAAAEENFAFSQIAGEFRAHYCATATDMHNTLILSMRHAEVHRSMIRAPLATCQARAAMAP